ncbi:MAG TPA: sigma-54 dependent transcriptional regulator [Calditrichia bacterium]|nr:sigma-54 dependent transcriptional regulator [Calditrichia bacterium]
MKKGRLLVIDDEDELRRLIVQLLTLEKYEVEEADSARKGLAKLRDEEFDVILSDVMLGDANGLDLIPQYKEIAPFSEVVMMTAFGSIEDGVGAIKAGAFDYITKGDEDNKIIPVIERALERAAMQRRIYRLENQLSEKYAFDNLIGKSQALSKATDMARKVAVADSPVLLTGETGTGKELFAQAIHNASARAKGAFVAVNCSAFARDLLESEMFGYKAGAFTGATKNKKGLFEEAEGGTLFLDEIGEMDVNLQAKILRALDSKTFIKAGDTKPTTVDVRIIAATNRDLLAEIESGNFREDLYYRISVINIHIPPLRQRQEDIPLLVEHFVGVFANRMNRRIDKIERGFMDKLKTYPYPGNIRELRNIVERAVILSEGLSLSPSVLPQDLGGNSRRSAGQAEYDPSLPLAEVEKQHIQRVLEYMDGNKTRAAEALGIGAATLYRKIDAYNL